MDVKKRFVNIYRRETRRGSVFGTGGSLNLLDSNSSLCPLSDVLWLKFDFIMW